MEVSEKKYSTLSKEVKDGVGWPEQYSDLSASQRTLVRELVGPVLQKEKLLFLAKELKMIQYEVGEISNELTGA